VEQSLEALHRQCLRRAQAYCRANRAKIPTIDALIPEVARLVDQNRERAQANARPDPKTGVPDEYVDDVIRCLIREKPLVDALKAGEAQAWEALLTLITRRVYASLRRYRIAAPHLHARADELVQHCAMLIWQALDRYRYDSTFESWVSVFVAFEVGDVCKSKGFQIDARALSWDTLSAGTPEGFGLDERIPDEGAYHHFQHLDRVLTVEAGMKYLSPDQREFIWRQLGGQTTTDIARGMARTRNAIYKIRQRTIAVLRAFISESGTR
jgi:DNA-directed RNA polymerase specialized sigma24 family protein